MTHTVGVATDVINETKLPPGSITTQLLEMVLLSLEFRV